MPSFYSRWICDTCETMYKSRDAAQRCEDSELPSLLVQEGDEIKLKNRDGKTYTIAVVKRLYLRNTYRDMGFNIDSMIMDQGWKKLLPIHTWYAELDREVLLDHKWESPSKDVNLGIYLVTNPEGMTRSDNNSGG